MQSPEEVTRCEPLGWKEIPEIQSLCPSPDIIRSPYGAVQIFQVKSSEAVAIIDFLGWIEIEGMAIICPYLEIIYLWKFYSKNNFWNYLPHKPVNYVGLFYLPLVLVKA